MPLYTPNAADAKGLLFTGQSFYEETLADADIDPQFVDARFFLKPVQDEILALIANDSKALNVVNLSGSTITKGSIVYVSGYDNGTSLPTIDLTDISGSVESDNSPASYVLDADILNGASGYVFSFKTITGLDTSAASGPGDPVYMSPYPGVWTLEEQNVDYKRLTIGVVTVKDATVGAILFYLSLNIDNSKQPYELPVFNNTGSIIPAGPVSIDRWNEGYLAFFVSPSVNKQADIIIGSNLAIGGYGRGCLLKTFISTIDTSGSATGDPVYLNADGTIGLVATAPSYQIIGYVKTTAVNGLIKGYVKQPVSSNCRWRGLAASDPSDSIGGDIYKNNGDGKVYLFDGSSYIALT